MDATMETGERAKARKKAGAKVPAKEEARKLSKNISLSPEAWERLAVHAIKTRQSESAVAEGLINAHLRRFVVSDRGGTTSEEPSAVQASEANLADATLPVGETVHPSPEVEAAPIVGAGERGDLPAPAPRRQAGRR